MVEFELIEKIGAGAFGEVWKGRDPGRQVEIAVKCLRLDRARSDFVELFKREFEILSELRNAHLAQVYDFGYWPEREQYYFTTEYCPGKSLLNAVAGKGAAYFEEVLVQILAALDCIHSQGIVHLDIKPENVIVADKGGRPHVKLLDFGIAARLKALSRVSGGTPAYMAPEILEGQKVDHRIDLYSLGMLSLVALKGGFPFDETNTQQVMEWQVRGRLAFDFWDGCDVPRYLCEIVEKLLAKQPSERFSSARVVLNFLNLATCNKYIRTETGLEGQIPSEGPLVERRDEILETLQARLTTCLFSEGRVPVSSVSFVTGEKGIGKTRILDELRYILELKEIPFLMVICDGLTPLWPQIADWLNVPPAEEDPDEEWTLRRRIDALWEAARSKPFALLIDDFHQAEREMRRLVIELSLKSERERAQGRPVKIFAVVATEDDLGEASRLSRLSRAGVSEYLRLVLGETPGREDMAELLHRYSGGLPLLMVEGLRFLAPKILRGDSPRELPGLRIDDLYRRRIDDLEDGERLLLRTLSLLSRAASEEELERILGKSSVVIARMAETPLRQGLIEGGFSVSFGVRAVTYAASSEALAGAVARSMEEVDRAVLHRRIAEGLKKGQGLLQEIAHHLQRAGDTEEAVDCYRRAGESLRAQGQVSSATECLLKAAAMTEEGSKTWQGLIVETARLLILAGVYDQAEACLKKLEPYPSAALDEAHGWLSLKQRRFGAAREFYHKALAQVPPEDLLKKIVMENALANTDLQEGHVKEAAERFRKTLSWESRLGETPSWEVTNNNLGLALSLQGDAAGAMEFYESRLRRASQSRPNEKINLLNGMGYVSLMASRYEEAIAYLTQATELAERSGAMHSLFTSMGNLITALLKEGYYAESLPLLRKMEDYQRRLGTQRDVAYNLLRQGNVYLTIGMSEAAWDGFGRGRGLAKEAGLKSLEIWFLLMEGYWEREFGSPDKAKEIFKETEIEAGKIPDKDLLAWSIYAQADLAHDLGEYESCQAHFDRIGPVGNDHEFEVRKELLEGKLEAADAPLKTVRALFERIEKNCLKNHFNEILWEAYHAWGLAMLRCGRPAEARDLFEKGVKIVESIAAALPEEYRDRYLNQKGRQKLFESRRLVGPAGSGVLARLKQVGRSKASPSQT